MTRVIPSSTKHVLSISTATYSRTELTSGRPLPVQNRPAGHVSHTTPCVALKNVPFGHATGKALPLGQWWNRGQKSPVNRSTGVVVLAPSRQKNPAEQVSFGAVNPGLHTNRNQMNVQPPC